MPKPNSAHITFVLDRSGSMQNKKEPTIAGFNKFIEEQKAVPGECTATLLQFDYPRQHEYVYRRLPLANAPALTEETFKPRGNTALVDAIGHAIDDTGADLAALAESERPAQVYVVILTDGEENASAEYQMTAQSAKPAWWNAVYGYNPANAKRYVSYAEPKRKIVADMIQHQKDKYNWQFIFLGADQDAIQTASKLNIGAGQTMSYAGGTKGTMNTYSAAACSVTQSRMTGQDLGQFTKLMREQALEKDDDQQDGSTPSKP